MINLLLLHGNGGANARFDLFRQWVTDRGPENLRLHLPELPGFEGRPLPPGDAGWPDFLGPLARQVALYPDEPWVFYGHGIGGSLLLEWAARDWDGCRPGLVILHGPIGASLEHRFFPKLMKPVPVRRLMQRLIHARPLQPVWERRLFQRPGSIPQPLRDRFFRDYERCAAFALFFDLITPDWYRRVQERVGERSFYFLWGAEERVVAARFLDYWRRDFPVSEFEIVPGWDHFPMLDQPEAFYQKITDLLKEKVAD